MSDQDVSPWNQTKCTSWWSWGPGHHQYSNGGAFGGSGQIPRFHHQLIFGEWEWVEHLQVVYFIFLYIPTCIKYILCVYIYIYIYCVYIIDISCNIIYIYYVIYIYIRIQYLHIHIIYYIYIYIYIYIYTSQYIWCIYVYVWLYDVLMYVYIYIYIYIWQTWWYLKNVTRDVWYEYIEEGVN